MEEALKEVSEAGDVNGLYSLIGQEPFILDRFDPIPFVDTPLHIAARDGKAKFAMEIAYLKPSLVRKLNQNGLSPMHLALAGGHRTIVRGLLQTDKEVVRVKGREGRTPLHEVALTGDADMLGEFLCACPESVEDLTVGLETALHLAVKSSNLEAFELLFEWLRRENNSEIVNWKDNEGNTVLHVATYRHQLEFVELLLSKRHIKGVEVNAMNSEGLTALDMLEQAREGDNYLKLFHGAGALKAQETISSKKRKTLLMVYLSKPLGVPILSRESVCYLPYKKNRSSSIVARIALLVVVALILTTTYESRDATGPLIDFVPNFNSTNIGKIIRHGRPFGERSCDGTVLVIHPFAILSNLLPFNFLAFIFSLSMVAKLTTGCPMQYQMRVALTFMLVNYIVNDPSCLVVLFLFALVVWLTRMAIQLCCGCLRRGSRKGSAYAVRDADSVETPLFA